MKTKTILFVVIGIVVLGLAGVVGVYAIHKIRAHARLAERQAADNSFPVNLVPEKTPSSAAKAAPANTLQFQPPPDKTPPLMREAYQLMGQGKTDAALEKLNAEIQASPNEVAAYNARGSIYTGKKLWDQAKQDFTKANELDGKNSIIKFNLVEINFMQKEYDAARPGFVVLEKDPDLGDLATYKVFLCDLFGGHEENASKELEAFNLVGANPSYFFANAAWNLYHQKTEDARGWLISAEHIYPPGKNELYASSLKELGYLPLPPPPPPQ